MAHVVPEHYADHGPRHIAGALAELIRSLDPPGWVLAELEAEPKPDHRVDVDELEHRAAA